MIKYLNKIRDRISLTDGDDEEYSAQEKASVITNIILIFLIFILLGVILYAVIYVDLNSIDCLKNPVDYFERLKEARCVCSLVTETHPCMVGGMRNLPYLNLTFNSTS